jgi:hypothetical protein
MNETRGHKTAPPPLRRPDEIFAQLRVKAENQG